MPVTEFSVEHSGETISILDAPVYAKSMDDHAGDEKHQEYLVPVEWTDARPVKEAIWKKEVFKNQNTVFTLRNQFTLERLTESFDVGKACS